MAHFFIITVAQNFMIEWLRFSLTITIKQMKKLGVFKPEYMEIMSIFSDTLAQYQAFEEKFEESGFKLTEEYTNKAGAVNDRKVPLYTAMESLRKDIITYSDRLCLNPKALEAVTVDIGSKSRLVNALREYE